MKTKIHRRCACGCGQITRSGNRWIVGHHRPWKGRHHTKETKRKMSLSKMGNIYSLGYKHSKETILKRSLSRIKHNPNYEYCDEWKDRQYRRDLRKDYCENADCKGKSKLLLNHHIDLNKKHCHPSNIMTMCASCSSTLHNRLGLDTIYKDYLTIIRKDHITYVYKKTRKIIAIIRRKEQIQK